MLAVPIPAYCCNFCHRCHGITAVPIPCSSLVQICLELLSVLWHYLPLQQKGHKDDLLNKNSKQQWESSPLTFTEAYSCCCACGFSSGSLLDVNRSRLVNIWCGKTAPKIAELMIRSCMLSCCVNGMRVRQRYQWYLCNMHIQRYLTTHSYRDLTFKNKTLWLLTPPLCHPIFIHFELYKILHT